MTETLKAKLRELVRQDTMAYELDEKVAQIDQAYKEAGYRLHVVGDFIDEKGKAHNVTTGQEWYDRFEKEVWHLDLPNRMIGKEVMAAARKASGLS